MKKASVLTISLLILGHLLGAEDNNKTIWPGSTLYTSSTWGTIISPGLGAGAYFGIGVRGLINLKNTGISLQGAYRWQETTHIEPNPGISLSISQRFNPRGPVIISPNLELGIDQYQGSLNPTLSGAIYLGLHLGGRNYLGLKPRMRIINTPGQLPYFELALELSKETAWLVPMDPPQIRMSIPNQTLSPDGDGRNEELIVNVDHVGNTRIALWSFSIIDQDEGVLFKNTAMGDIPPRIVWNGGDDPMTTLEPANNYWAELTITDVLGRTTSLRQRWMTDIFVYQDGDVYKIKVPPIVFPSDSWALREGDVPWIVERNYQVLKRLIELFDYFPEYTMIVEGHANATKWDRPQELQMEEEKELLPLSAMRAQAVAEALIRLGMDPQRIKTLGRGSSRPLVPFKDVQEAWRNRRVEFILVR